MPDPSSFIPPQWGPFWFYMASYSPLAALRTVDGVLKGDLTSEDVCVEVCCDQVLKLKRIEGHTLEDPDLNDGDSVRVSLWEDCTIVSIHKRGKQVDENWVQRPGDGQAVQV